MSSVRLKGRRCSSSCDSNLADQCGPAKAYVYAYRRRAKQRTITASSRQMRMQHQTFIKVHTRAACTQAVGAALTHCELRLEDSEHSDRSALTLNALSSSS